MTEMSILKSQEELEKIVFRLEARIKELILKNNDEYGMRVALQDAVIERDRQIKELVQAGNELDGLLVTIMQQEYVTGTLPFTDHGRSFASSAHDKWQSIVESSDADNG